MSKKEGTRDEAWIRNELWDLLEEKGRTTPSELEERVKKNVDKGDMTPHERRSKIERVLDKEKGHWVEIDDPMEKGLTMGKEVGITASAAVAIPLTAYYLLGCDPGLSLLLPFLVGAASLSLMNGYNYLKSKKEKTIYDRRGV